MAGQYPELSTISRKSSAGDYRVNQYHSMRNHPSSQAPCCFRRSRRLPPPLPAPPSPPPPPQPLTLATASNCVKLMSIKLESIVDVLLYAV